MSPILGVVASSNSPSIYGNSYVSLGTYTGTGSSGNITFSSIPQTYKHLQIRAFINTNRVGGATGSGSMYFNGDTTGTNYYTHAGYCDYSGNAAAFAANENYGVWWYGDSTTYVGAVVDILDYASTSKKTTAKIFTGFDQNSNGWTAVASLFWNNTAAVNQIVLNAQGQNWGTNARFSLYGIKG